LMVRELPPPFIVVDVDPPHRPRRLLFFAA
jgi:hypothetical protein